MLNKAAVNGERSIKNNTPCSDFMPFTLNKQQNGRRNNNDLMMGGVVGMNRPTDDKIVGNMNVKYDNVD
jgi:hypothetical protein